MWTTEHTLETAASQEAIRRVWADVPHRGEWNPDIERIAIDGPFAAGSTITMTPGGQEPVVRLGGAISGDFPEVLAALVERAQR